MHAPPQQRLVLAAPSSIALAGVLLLAILVAILGDDARPVQMDRWFDATLGRSEDDGVSRLGSLLLLPGTTTGSAIIGLSVGGYYLITRRTWVPLGLALVCYVGTFATAFVIKREVDRVSPRFYLDPAHPSGVSFPSAHVARAAAMLGITVVILAILEGRGMAILAGVAGLAALMATASAQLILRLHWATDVIGSVAIAVFWVSLMVPIAIYRLPSDRRRSGPGLSF